MGAEGALLAPTSHHRSSWATPPAGCSPRSCLTTFGAAGVAINSAPTEGMKRIPLSQVRASFPVLKNPANRHRAVGLTDEQWHYTFTNGFSDEESLRLYERHHIPASGAILWRTALANIHPGKDDTGSTTTTPIGPLCSSSPAATTT